MTYNININKNECKYILEISMEKYNVRTMLSKYCNDTVVIVECKTTVELVYIFCKINKNEVRLSELSA